MTADEADGFYAEKDEDPKKIFAKFDAGPKGVTAARAPLGEAPAGNESIYVQAIGLYGELRRESEFPEVSAAGPRSYGLGRA